MCVNRTHTKGTQVAVKEAVQDWVRYDQDYRALKSLPKDIQLLSANNKALMASFDIGADGVIIGSGSLYPEWATPMFSAIQNSDLDTARRIHQRMQSLTEVMYQEPACDVYTRIKTAQVMMGRLENAVVRPPLLPFERRGEGENGQSPARVRPLGSRPRLPERGGLNGAKFQRRIERSDRS